jgi:hypothetical protein
MPLFALGCLLINSVPAAEIDARPTTQSVEQLLDALGSKSMLTTLEGQLDGMMKRSIQQALNGKPLTPAQEKIMDDMRAKTIALISQQLTWESIKPVFIDIYQKNFSQKEVDGMLVFYRSEIGKAVVAKLPQAMMASMQTMQSKMTAILPQIQGLQRDTVRQLEATESPQSPALPPTQPASH